MAKTLRVEIVGDSTSLQRALNRASAASGTFAGRMKASGESIAATGASMTKKLTLPLVATGAVATKFASDFGAAMELIHTQAGAPQREVEKLKQSVLDLAPAVATGPNELAKGLYHLESQGLRGAKAMDALRVAAEGARLGQADLEDVTNALGAAVTVGLKGTENYDKAMGALNATVGTGDMRMQDLADAMGTQLVGQAKIAGVSITDLGGALAVFGDANIRGAHAGTMLSQAIRVLGAGSKATDKALKGIGLSNLQLSQEMRKPNGLIGALTLLQQKMDAAGMSADQQAIFISRAFGGKQAAGIKLLLVQLDRLKMKTDEVGKGANSFAAVWNDTTKTTAFKFKAMEASIEAALIGIGGHLIGPITAIANAVRSAAQWFDHLSPGMQKVILIAAGVAAALGPMTSVIGHAVSAVGSLSTAFMFLAANPAVLLIAGIAAVAAAIAAAVIWPDKFAAVLERMGVSAQHAQEIVSTLQGVFQQVRQLVQTAVGIVQGIWARFGDVIVAQARAFWNLIEGEFRAAFQIIEGLVNIFGGLLHGDWSRVWEGIKQVFSGEWNAIVTIVRFELNTLRNVLTAGLRAVEMLVTGVWHAIEANAKTAWNNVVAAVRAVVGRATAAAAAVGHGIVTGVRKGLDALAGAVKGGLDVIWGVISNVAAHAYNAAKAIGASIIHGIADGIKSMVGEAVSAVEHAGGSVLHAATGFLHINSPSLLFSEEVGSPIMEGIIHGILSQEGNAESATKGALAKMKAAATTEAAQIVGLVNRYGKEIGLAHARGVVMGIFQGTPSIVQQAKQALIEATAAAKQAVVDAKAGFASAFSQMANEALAAFDAKMANWTPPAQALLDKMQLQDQIDQAKQAVAQAQQQLAQAQQAQAAYQPGEAETPDQIAADQAQLAQAVVQAQQGLQAAERAQKEQELQMLAAKQTEIHNAVIAKQREGLAKQLAQLQTELEKHPKEWDKMGAKVKALLAKYHIPMVESGKAWASKFADGIRQGIPAAVAAAKALAQAVDNYMPHSPAKEGPLAYDAADSGRAWAERFAYGFHNAFGQSAPVAAFSGGSGRAAFVGSGGGGGGAPVVVHVHGALMGSSAPEVADVIRREFIRLRRNNVSIGF